MTDIATREIDPFWGEELPPPPAEDQYPAYEPVDAVVAPAPSYVDVKAVLSRVLAALQGARIADLDDLVRRLQSEQWLRHLDDANGDRDTYADLLELLGNECSIVVDGTVDYASLHLAPTYSVAVNKELAVILAAVPGSRDVNVAATLTATREQLQRLEALRWAYGYSEKLSANASTEKLLACFEQAVAPTVLTGRSTTERPDWSAAATLAEHQNRTGGASRMRLSLGIPTLDLSLTKPGEAQGAVNPGGLTVIAGLQGTGKSTFTYTALAGVCLDLKAQGLPDAKVVLFHTEEESIDKINSAGFGVGGRYHHLAHMLVVVYIGNSRTKMVEVLYDLVASAHEQAQSTGRSITEFLPHAIFVDYVQQILEESDKGDRIRANDKTADLLLNGFAKWVPSQMALFGDLSYSAHTGSVWPVGQEHHRVAVIAFAQFKTQDDRNMYYRGPRGDKPGMPLGDFAKEVTPNAAAPLGQVADSEGYAVHGPDGKPLDWYQENVTWVAPDGVRYTNQVREGDLRMLRKEAIEYGKRYLNHAEVVFFLHRSNPYNNPAVRDPATGQMRLADPRANLVLEKMRHGAAMTVIPMHFDIRPDGGGVYWRDWVAEQFLQEGRLQVGTHVDPSYTRKGDPMLPVRRRKDPLQSITY